MLAVKDLSVTYQKNKVLNGFNLNLELSHT
jgi:Fe-S cluster assembly ATPase SufC